MQKLLGTVLIVMPLLTACNAMTSGADRINATPASYTQDSDTQYPTQDLSQDGERAEFVKQSF